MRDFFVSSARKNPVSDKQTWVKVDGGILVQDNDLHFSDDIKVVTEVQPTEEQKKARAITNRNYYLKHKAENEASSN